MRISGINFPYAYRFSLARTNQIDIDHLHLIVKEKAFTYKKIIELSQNIYDQSSIKKCFKDVTYALHTIETNILLLVLSNWYTPLFYIAIGFLFHIICDIIHHCRKKLPILSWLILTNYFIRLIRKNF